MSAYSVSHLALSGICAVMAAIHLAMWLAIRTERAQLWVALSFVGFVILDIGVAGSSVGSNGHMGPAAPWLLLLAPTAVALPWTLLRTVWAVLDRPMNAVRRHIIHGAALLVLPMLGALIYFSATDDPRAASWESAHYTHIGLAVPFQLALFGVAAIWLWEGWQARARLRGIAIAAVVASVPAVVLNVREIGLMLHIVDGPTLYGIAGLPFAVFASVSLVSRYVEAIRSAQQTDPDDRYRRLHRLGAGGMGELWLTIRTGAAGFRRYVVLKRMRLDRPDTAWVERFMAEARVAARLHHPNIVSVYDLGRLRDGWFIVMEYLAGASLIEIAQRCWDERIEVPVELVAAAGEQMCQGLECAHSHGILHRDISPDNVIVTFEGVAKILDFGIAKEAGVVEPDSQITPLPKTESGGSTGVGTVMGKKRYLAPERLMGESATVAADIFSLGLVLLELLVGELPKRGADLAGHPEPLKGERPDVPEALQRVIRRSLESHPKQRYGSAAAMAYDMHAVRMELGNFDPGAWVRQHFGKRHSLEQKLSSMTEPDAEEVAALFAATVDPTQPADVSSVPDPAPERPYTPGTTPMD